MRILWQLSCAVALGIASTIGVGAAELDVLPAPYAAFRAPPPRAFNWTSCYLGGHFGWGLADNEITGTFLAPLPNFSVPTSVTTASTVPIDLGANGFLLGGQVGCNLQVANSWVIGFEADASWANIQASNRQTLAGAFTDPLLLTTTTVSSDGTLSTKTDFIATATARLGYAIGWMGQGLVYGKGGAAWITNRYNFTGQVTFSGVCTAVSPPPPQCLASTTQIDVFTWTSRKTLVGWTIGAGVEWVMWGNWTIKGEYDFLDFGNQTVVLNDQVFGPVNVSVRQRINEFKVGFNYRFGPPVVDRAPW